jgi:hypothetical protein
MFHYTKKTQEFHIGYMITRHTVILFDPRTLQPACNGANERRLLRFCDREPALGKDTNVQ